MTTPVTLPPATDQPLSRAALQAHLKLQWRLLRFLKRHAPWLTLFNTLARAVSEFAQLFAFFIPIKIIILMGSESVPNYLAGLVTADTRNTWIVGLSLLTVLLYVLAISLMFAARTLSARAADRLAEAAHLTDDTNRQQFHRIHTIACRAYAHLMIVVVGILALFVVDVQIFVASVTLLALEFWLTHSGLVTAKPFFARMGGLVARNPGLYLRYLGNLNFLGVFVVLLAEYAATGKLNTLTAILSLLLARRIFQSAAILAQRALALQRKRHELAPILTYPIVHTHAA